VFVPSIVRIQGDSATTLIECFGLAVIATTVQIAGFMVASFNLGLQRFAAQASVFIVASTVGVVVSLVCLFKGLGLYAFPYAMLARAVVILGGHALVLARWSREYLPGRLSLDGSEFRAVTSLSGYTLMGRLGATIVTQLDTVLASRYVAPNAAAVLSLNGRAFDPVSMLTSRVAPALSPGIANLTGQGDTARLRDVMRRIGRVTIWALGVGTGAVIALNEPFVKIWVGPGFYGGKMLTVLQGLAICAVTVAGFLSNSLYATGRIRETSVVSGVQAVATLGLQVLLVRVCGIWGLPAATLASWTLVSCASYVYLSAKQSSVPLREESMYWLRGAVVLAFLCLTGLCAAFLISRLGLRWNWWRLCAAGVVVGGGLLGLLLAAESEARNELGALVQRTSSMLMKRKA